MTEQQDRRVAAQVGDVLDEVEEGGLTPVRVVEDNDQRALGGALLEQLPERPRDLVGRTRGGLLAENRGEGWSVRGLCAELLGDLGHRPVADSLAVRETATTHDGCIVSIAEELGDKARLADSCRAEHSEQVAGALADDVRKRMLEQLSLPLPAHHLRPVAPRDRRPAGPDCEETERWDRLRLALQLERRDRLDLDRIPDEPERLLAEQHLARLRGLFESRGDVDGIAGREPLLGSCHNLAGVHASSKLEPGAVRVRELRVQHRERLPQVLRGAHGT